MYTNLNIKIAIVLGTWHEKLPKQYNWLLPIFCIAARPRPITDIIKYIYDGVHS
jgi:hypothetical protein